MRTIFVIYLILVTQSIYPYYNSYSEYPSDRLSTVSSVLPVDISYPTEFDHYSPDHDGYIAILDTGIELTDNLQHKSIVFQDFIGRSATEKNDLYEYPSDINGHGTMIASIITSSVYNPSDTIRIETYGSSINYDTADGYLSISTTNNTGIMIDNNGDITEYDSIAGSRYEFIVNAGELVISSDIPTLFTVTIPKLITDTDVGDGILPFVPIIMLKVLDDQGVGTVQSTLDAISWLYLNYIRYNIKVINLSYNFNSVIPEIDEAIDQLMAVTGIHVVVSAGNNDRMHSPASSNAIVIANNNMRWLYNSTGVLFVDGGTQDDPITVAVGNHFIQSYGDSISTAVATAIIYYMVYILEMNNTITTDNIRQIVYLFDTLSFDDTMIFQNHISINEMYTGGGFHISTRSNRHYTLNIYADNINGVYFRFHPSSDNLIISYFSDSISRDLFDSYDAEYYIVFTGNASYSVNNNYIPDIQVNDTVYSKSEYSIEFYSVAVSADMYIDNVYYGRVYPYKEIILTAGTYSIRLREINTNTGDLNYGSYAEVVYTLIIDTEVPSFVIINPPVYADDIFNISISISDNHGIDYYSIDTGIDMIVIGSTLTLIPYHLAHGLYNISITVYDLSGNHNSSSFQILIETKFYVIIPDTQYSDSDTTDILFDMYAMTPVDISISDDIFAWAGSNLTYTVLLSLGENHIIIIIDYNGYTIQMEILINYIPDKVPELYIESDIIDITHDTQIILELMYDHTANVTYYISDEMNVLFHNGTLYINIEESDIIVIIIHSVLGFQYVRYYQIIMTDLSIPEIEMNDVDTYLDPYNSSIDLYYRIDDYSQTMLYLFDNETLLYSDLYSYRYEFDYSFRLSPGIHVITLIVIDMAGNINNHTVMISVGEYISNSDRYTEFNTITTIRILLFLFISGMLLIYRREMNTEVAL